MPIYSDASIISDLKDNLNNKLFIAFQRFIQDLLQRNHHDSVINQYRVFNLATNSYITSFDDFVNNISDIKVNYAYTSSCDVSNNTPHPFFIKIQNYEVRLMKESLDDSYYFEKYGSQEKKKITFLCNLPFDSSLTFQIVEILLSND